MLPRSSLLLKLSGTVADGMFVVGVPGLPQIGPHSTTNQSMVAASGLLSLALLTMAIILPTWCTMPTLHDPKARWQYCIKLRVLSEAGLHYRVPTHFTYGCQQKETVAVDPQPCTWEADPPIYCIASQVSSAHTRVCLCLWWGTCVVHARERVPPCRVPGPLPPSLPRLIRLPPSLPRLIRSLSLSSPSALADKHLLPALHPAVRSLLLRSQLGLCRVLRDGDGRGALPGPGNHQ